MRQNDTLKRLAAVTLMAAAVFLAASEADAYKYDMATFHRYSGNTSTPAAPADPLGTAGTVAGHSGTGEAITKAAEHAQIKANIPGGKNVSGWSKAGKWLGRLGTAIDIVSPASRIAGHAWEGDWSGAGWAAVDEGSKKFATTKGAAAGGAAGTFVGGPAGTVIGGIAGAAAAEEIHTRTAGVLYDKAAQATKDQETWDRLAGHRMRDRNRQGSRTRVRTHVPTLGSKPPTVRTGCRCGRGR